MKFKKISPLTSYTYCTDKSDDGGSVAVRTYIYYCTLSPSFCRHFFLSLSLLFSRILTSHSVQYSMVYTTTVHVHTHFIRFFGPPNTQSDTELFIDKLHRTSASEIYIYDFFYAFILFVLKIPPLRCARIILSCITLNVTVSLLLYTYIYINVWFTVIYIYNNTTLYDVQFSCPQSRVYYARALPLYMI